jgi:hypothetical protein
LHWQSTNFQNASWIHMDSPVPKSTAPSSAHLGLHAALPHVEKYATSACRVWSYRSFACVE